MTDVVSWRVPPPGEVGLVEVLPGGSWLQSIDPVYREWRFADDAGDGEVIDPHPAVRWGDRGYSVYVSEHSGSVTDVLRIALVPTFEEAIVIWALAHGFADRLREVGVSQVGE